uniref:MUS1 n=1 Tax=Arundo donax TaxID=35708 RepID=A0A0A9GIM8_ARUDO
MDLSQSAGRRHSLQPNAPRADSTFVNGLSSGNSANPSFLLVISK